MTWRQLQDGYAVVAADGPGEYPVVGASRAGDDNSEVHLQPGTVTYITTGGGCEHLSEILTL
jgi:gephyrin